MIPFILIAAGSYFIYDSTRTKKLSHGDYLPEKEYKDGDELVLKFKNDSWLELYDEGEEYPSIEIPFQAGETFEVTLFDVDDYQFHAVMEDGSLAFIPKNEVEVVAVNDEVSAFAKGGNVSQKYQERLEELVSRYVKDPDDVSKEMTAYEEKGYRGFSDSVQANLSRDMDFITLAQMEHDEDKFRKERGYAKGGIAEKKKMGRACTYAKGGKTKYWIQDAIKKKGALRATAKKEGLIKGDEKLSMTDLKKLEKKGGKTAQRARLAETLKKMKDGGEVDSKEWEKKSTKQKEAYIKKNGEVYVDGEYFLLIGGRLAIVGKDPNDYKGKIWTGYLYDFADASYDDGEWVTSGSAWGTDKESVIEKLEEEYKRLTSGD